MKTKETEALLHSKEFILTIELRLDRKTFGTYRELVEFVETCLEEMRGMASAEIKEARNQHGQLLDVDEFDG